MPFSCFFSRMSILSAILKGVSAPLCKREVNELIYLTVDEEEIITTENHPFYVKDRGFVPAGKLKPGDEVLLSDGTTAKIRKVEEHHLETPVCVYNFEVEELHTYLVGTKGIVVHNDCAEPVPEGGSGSKTYMTGTEGEEELARLVGGKSQQYRKTSLGGRYIDQLSADNIAHESKVGYTTLTKRIRTQILKDAELINTGRIEGAHWHFFTSGVTGKGGASQPLLDFLTENGISYTIH